MVAKLAEMLKLAQIGYVEAECPHCDELVEWTPLLAESTGVTSFGTGHYYLTADMPRTVDTQTQKTVAEGDKLCLNLNGYTMETEGRTFSVNNSGEVSIFNIAFEEAGSTGVIRSYAEDNNPGGGLATVSAGGIFNLYGGTLEFEAEDDAKYGTGVGGIFSLTGTLNMYGGTINGAELVDSSYGFSSDGCGGAIYMYAGAHLNVYGGTITSGTLPETNDLPTAGGTVTAKGPCVYVSASTARVKLANNANVENIYFVYSSGDLLTVEGDYTGTATVTMKYTLKEGLDFGAATGYATAPNLTSVKYESINAEPVATGYNVRVSGPNLILTQYGNDVVAMTGTTGYTTLQDAIDAYKGDLTNYAIKLLGNNTEAVTLSESRTVVIDLNGYSLSSATATAGKLKFMDSATIDYDVTDGMYGRVLAHSGNIESFNNDGKTGTNVNYLKVEDNSVLSFHAVNLLISAMSLRATENGVSTPSVYYQSNFQADHMAAAKIQSYGIAMSTTEAPTKDNINDEKVCRYSTFTGFESGATGNAANGTLLKGIMKPTNSTLVNRRNAKVPVYGAAYVLTDDGYMMGKVSTRTLEEQTVAADGIWTTLKDEQKKGMVTMYESYTSVMKSWSLPMLAASMGPKNDGVLKVLVIGNSHGLDATNLLYEVFEDQGYDEQELILGALYYSGCNMSQHADFMTNGKAVYSYYENDGSNADGSWNIQEAVKADVALDAHNWDIVILQQMNHRAAHEEDYVATDFKTVINYVKANQAGLPKFGWHMVWTNPDGAEYLGGDANLSHPDTTSTAWVDTHKAWFPNDAGNYSQSVMYNKLMEYTQKYIEDDVSFLGSDVFDFVIPAATAVEYAQDELGLTQAQVYRDYTHMNDYGRLIAAYTWYAKILELDQIPAVGIDAIPEVLHHSNSEYPTADSGYAVTDDMKKLIRNAVNYALDNPYELPAEEDNTVSILGIGNSYTIDSMWMLGEVYQVENPGKNVQLGIAYRSGETLSGHVTNISEGNTYHYFYWDSTSDKWTVTAGQTLGQIINAQDWEMVSLQQGSAAAGRVATMNDNIDTIQTYVEEQLGYVPTYLWNATWAYPEEDIEGDAYDFDETTDAAYPPNYNSFQTYYGGSQATMYKMIMDVVEQKVLPNATFEYLMPVGTAVQNANGTLTDHELYRDYTHLSDFSRLMAAYTWYCELELVVLDDFQLKALPTVNCSSSSWYNGSARDLTADELALAIQCVKDAMKDNLTTTDASVYAE